MTFKDFETLAKLGEGAYSCVYKVRRQADSQIYALKQVKMSTLSEKEQENALNEVRILASLNCPYIVGYKEAFIQANSLCIVMDFSDDGDLYQRIIDHQKNHSLFEETNIWKTLIQVTIGLNYLHEMNILHRDLKSANVFLNKSGVARLGDMNVSKIAKNGLLYTQTGTPYYASPEVWKDNPYDCKSDIWSLGCVIYEMATLKPPFRADDMDALYRRVIKGSYQKIGDHYSSSLSATIKSMLQVDPSNRPTAAQLLKNLAGKAAELGLDLQAGQSFHNKLLQTIRPNKKLHYLTDRLPKANYNNEQKMKKISLSTLKPLNSSPSSYPQPKQTSNLPRLERVITKVKPLSKYLGSISPKIEEDHSILKIQGRGSQHNDIESLKNEIRRRYNVREVPKVPRRVIQLPRIK